MVQRDRALNKYNNAVDKNNALVDNNGVIDNGSIDKLRRLFFYNGSDCGSLLKNDRDVDLTMLVDLGDLQLLF